MISLKCVIFKENCALQDISKANVMRKNYALGFIQCSLRVAAKSSRSALRR